MKELSNEEMLTINGGFAVSGPSLGVGAIAVGAVALTGIGAVGIGIVILGNYMLL